MYQQMHHIYLDYFDRNSISNVSFKLFFPLDSLHVSFTAGKLFSANVPEENQRNRITLTFRNILHEHLH